MTMKALPNSLLKSVAVRLKGEICHSFNALKSIKKNQYLRLTKILLVAFLLSLFPSPNIYYSVSVQPGPFNKLTLQFPSPPPIPINYTGISPPNLTAEGIVVKDMNSGITLFSKNPGLRLSPASTTKLATALVALDHYKLDDVLTVKSVEHTPNVMGLVPDEKITFESLLYGLLVGSANDAAITIAENYTGGVSSFIDAMNKKAVSLHLDNTHYSNPVGFDDPNQYTTAENLSRLASVALRNKELAKVVGTRSITVSDTNYTYFHELRNVNQLLGEIPGVAGVKTGYTQNAAECLVAFVRRNDNEILTVVLRSTDRFKETGELIFWVFQNYKWVTVKDYQKSIQTGLGQ